MSRSHMSTSQSPIRVFSQLNSPTLQFLMQPIKCEPTRCGEIPAIEQEPADNGFHPKRRRQTKLVDFIDLTGEN